MLSRADWRPLAASHSSTVRASCTIVARSEPSGENATPSMLRAAPRGCTRTFQRSAPAGTSRAIRSPSISPTTTRLPSGLRATAFTTARRPGTSSTRVAVTGDGPSAQPASASPRAIAAVNERGVIWTTLSDNRAMHIVVGAIFVVLGATCVAYLWAGGSVLEREPPLLALGVLLIALAAGLGGRSRAAALLARAALGAGLVAIGWIATRYLSFGGLHDTDELIRRVPLLGLAVLAAAVVFLFILVRHVPYPRDFRTIDLVPLAGLAAALALGVAWFVGDDTRLRPCRLGNDLACDVVATHLIESAERAPAAPPTRWEEQAARVLDKHSCRSSEPGACAIQRYAVGSVALRAGRFDTAKEAFLRACAEDRSWGARAAQERSLAWTPDERARLERPR